jgi:hypothetical protein
VGVAFAVEGDGVRFASESYAAPTLYTTLASLSGALSGIRRASLQIVVFTLLGVGLAQSRGRSPSSFPSNNVYLICIKRYGVHCTDCRFARS